MPDIYETPFFDVENFLLAADENVETMVERIVNERLREKFEPVSRRLDKILTMIKLEKNARDLHIKDDDGPITSDDFNSPAHANQPMPLSQSVQSNMTASTASFRTLGSSTNTLGSSTNSLSRSRQSLQDLNSLQNDDPSAPGNSRAATADDRSFSVKLQMIGQAATADELQQLFGPNQGDLQGSSRVIRHDEICPDCNHSVEDCICGPGDAALARNIVEFTSELVNVFKTRGASDENVFKTQQKSPQHASDAFSNTSPGVNSGLRASQEPFLITGQNAKNFDTVIEMRFQELRDLIFDADGTKQDEETKESEEISEKRRFERAKKIRKVLEVDPAEKDASLVDAIKNSFMNQINKAKIDRTDTEEGIIKINKKIVRFREHFKPLAAKAKELAKVLETFNEKRLPHYETFINEVHYAALEKLIHAVYYFWTLLSTEILAETLATASELAAGLEKILPQKADKDAIAKKITSDEESQLFSEKVLKESRDQLAKIYEALFQHDAVWDIYQAPIKTDHPHIGGFYSTRIQGKEDPQARNAVWSTPLPVFSHLLSEQVAKIEALDGWKNRFKSWLNPRRSTIEIQYGLRVYGNLRTILRDCAERDLAEYEMSWQRKLVEGRDATIGDDDCIIYTGDDDGVVRFSQSEFKALRNLKFDFSHFEGLLRDKLLDERGGHKLVSEIVQDDITDATVLDPSLPQADCPISSNSAETETESKIAMDDVDDSGEKERRTRINQNSTTSVKDLGVE